MQVAVRCIVQYFENPFFRAAPSRCLRTLYARALPQHLGASAHARVSSNQYPVSEEFTYEQSVR